MESSGSKDTRVNGVLETTEVPENGRIGIRAPSKGLDKEGEAVR